MFMIWFASTKSKLQFLSSQSRRKEDQKRILNKSKATMDCRSIAMAILLLCVLEFHLGVSKRIQKGDTILGIDLGTNTCVGVYRNGEVEIIPNDQGNRTTPSWIAFTDTEILIGEAAMNQAFSNPKRTVFDINRLIGRQFEDEKLQKDINMLPYNVVNISGKPYVEVKLNDGEVKAFSPEEISAIVLRNIKATAESYLGEKVEYAIMNVPAYFDDAQRQATEEAATIAGLNVIRLIHEPTAAAIAYDLETAGQKNILVYDLGGRTLDVSVLDIDNGVYEILSKRGSTHLGGEDFNHRLMEHFVEIFKKKHGKDMSMDNKALGKLRRECERAKRELSIRDQVRVEIESLFEGVDFFETLTRARFEELNEDLFKESIEFVKKAMEDAKLNKSEIHDIVLVGGSTRIPKIQELLNELFEGKQPIKGHNPEEVVAYGAAFHGRVYVENVFQEPLILHCDLNPLSLGIETVGGVMTTIVDRNRCLPFNNSKVFTTYEDLQTTVEIKVFEGERSLTKYCNELGQLTLSDIPPAPRGVAKIKVAFEVHCDWILVTAEDKGTKNKQSISINITNEGRLRMMEIERMVDEAWLFEEEDKKVMERLKPQNQLPASGTAFAIEGYNSV